MKRMKKLVLIALALVAIETNAQQRMERPDRRDMERKMVTSTPAVSAELNTKTMTSPLDVTEAQQTEVYALNLRNAQQLRAKLDGQRAKRENGQFERPTKEERFNRLNTQLDEQIATKAQMKSILNAEQYKKWNASNEHRTHRFKTRIKDNKRFAQKGIPYRQRQI